MGHQRIPLKTLCLPFLLWCPEVHPPLPGCWRVDGACYSLLPNQPPQSQQEQLNGTHRTIQGWHKGKSREAAIPTSNHSSAQHPHPKACEAVIRPHSSTGTQTERSQNTSWNRAAQAALGTGGKERRGEDRIKIKPNRKKNSGWGRYHGRLHWGCFFWSAYYTGFVVALWLRQKNMVLVPLLGSRGSKKMTVLLQSQPSPQTLPSPQAPSPRRGRKKERCPGRWTSSFPQRQQML